jgi:hypothetical protein
MRTVSGNRFTILPETYADAFHARSDCAAT